MKKLVMSLALVVAVSFCSAEVKLHDIISGAQDLNIRDSADIASVVSSADIGQTVTAIVVQSNGDIVLGTEGGVLVKYDKTLTLQKNFVGGFGGKITSLDVMSNDNVVAGVLCNLLERV